MQCGASQAPCPWLLLLSLLPLQLLLLLLLLLLLVHLQKSWFQQETPSLLQQLLHGRQQLLPAVAAARAPAPATKQELLW